MLVLVVFFIAFRWIHLSTPLIRLFLLLLILLLMPTLNFLPVWFAVSLLFFFQAEDGIRDWSVTGVQTCALPISRYHAELLQGKPPREGTLPGGRRLTVEESAIIQTFPEGVRFSGSRSSQYAQVGNARSEERRVGKECRSGGSPSHSNKTRYRLHR